MATEILVAISMIPGGFRELKNYKNELKHTKQKECNETWIDGAKNKLSVKR